MGYQPTPKDPNEALYKAERLLVKNIQAEHAELLSIYQSLITDAITVMRDATKLQKVLDDIQEARQWLATFYVQTLEQLQRMTICTWYEEAFFKLAKARIA